MITQVIDGKRIVPKDFNPFDGSLDTIAQIFKECKLYQYDIDRFCMTTKSGNSLTIIIDMQHMYPNFTISINNEIKCQWTYIPSSEKKNWLFYSPETDCSYLDITIGKTILFDNILDKIRYCWANS